MPGPQRSTPPDSPSSTRGDLLAFTMRFTPEESFEIDEWIIGLKRKASRNRVDRSEVIRLLLKLARENPILHNALVDELAP